MGPRRELKFALEKYWKGAIDQQELVDVAQSVEDTAWKLQVEAGVDRITVGDYYLYDAVLSWAEWLGLFPTRFQTMPRGLDHMFAMARGVDGATALSKFQH
jgi:5-methyltetrahydropteroyltriglutamate--homocysteine methyltransferase